MPILVALLVALCSGEQCWCVQAGATVKLLLSLIPTITYAIQCYGVQCGAKGAKLDLKSAAAKAAWGFKSPLGHQESLEFERRIDRS